MDPITMYRLGKIQQQEYLDSCLRDQQRYEVEGVAVTLLKRLSLLVSAATAPNERPQTTPMAAPVECGENFATSR